VHLGHDHGAARAVFGCDPGGAFTHRIRPRIGLRQRIDPDPRRRVDALWRHGVIALRPGLRRQPKKTKHHPSCRPSHRAHPLPRFGRRKLAHQGGAVNPWPALGRGAPNAYNHAMTDPAYSDPLDWRGIRAPALEEIEIIAIEAFRRLPTKFRDLCEDLVIRVEDFPTDEVLDQMGAETEF